jgi:hypothetical protein
MDYLILECLLSMRVTPIRVQSTMVALCRRHAGKMGGGAVGSRGQLGHGGEDARAGKAGMHDDLTMPLV